jgi:predicted transcriptional regulator
MRSKSERIINEIVELVNERYFSSGSVPTVREIAEAVGLDKSNVSRYLSEMQERGVVTRGGARGIETARMRKVREGVVYLPIVGEILRFKRPNRANLALVGNGCARI